MREVSQCRSARRVLPRNSTFFHSWTCCLSATVAQDALLSARNPRRLRVRTDPYSWLIE
jgi:hypothetical protein